MTPNQAAQTLVRAYALWLARKQAEAQKVTKQFKAHWVQAPNK